MLRGLLLPFQRDRKRDLASGVGQDLLASKVKLVLMTEAATPLSSGELPWRTTFGSGVHVLRHGGQTAALAELARVYARDALRKWMPEIEVLGVAVEQAAESLVVLVRFQSREGGGQPADVRVELPIQQG